MVLTESEWMIKINKWIYIYHIYVYYEFWVCNQPTELFSCYNSIYSRHNHALQWKKKKLVHEYNFTKVKMCKNTLYTICNIERRASINKTKISEGATTSIAVEMKWYCAHFYLFFVSSEHCEKVMQHMLDVYLLIHVCMHACTYVFICLFRWQFWKLCYGKYPSCCNRGLNLHLTKPEQWPPSYHSPWCDCAIFRLTHFIVLIV